MAAVLLALAEAEDGDVLQPDRAGSALGALVQTASSVTHQSACYPVAQRLPVGETSAHLLGERRRKRVASGPPVLVQIASSVTRQDACSPGPAALLQRLGATSGSLLQLTKHRSSSDSSAWMHWAWQLQTHHNQSRSRRPFAGLDLDVRAPTVHIFIPSVMALLKHQLHRQLGVVVGEVATVGVGVGVGAVEVD